MNLSLEYLLEWLRAPLEAGPRQERAALAFLGGDGCPACALAAESEERWARYFIAQGYAEPEVFQATRAALGPCPRHRRRLVAARGGMDVYATVAVWLAREAMKRAGAGHAPSPCPPCAREAWAEEHAEGTILRTMHRGPVWARLEAGHGFCLPHLLQVLSRGLSGGPAERLAGLTRAALDRPVGPALLGRLCGRDEDAPSRAEELRAAVIPDRGPSLHEWVHALLALEGCPVCLAERSAVRGALRWVGAPAEHESWELRFCPGHLATLAALEPAAAEKAAGAMAAEWSGALGRYLEALARARGPGRRKERAAALSKLLGNRACRACDVQRTAGERTGALVAAALRDRPLAEAYSRAHGLCWQHLAALGAGAPAVAVETLQARLALLGWELEEAQRKRNWFARWEPAGEEAGAWRRLPGLLGDAGAASRGPGWRRTGRER